MSPIEEFLARVEKRLLVRRRYRGDILEEMRGHLEALESERAAPFAAVDEVAAAFGEPRTLARRINASVPWAQARLPWSLVIIGPVAMALLGLLMVPVVAMTGRVSGHGPVAVLMIATAMTAIWLVYFIGPFAAMAYGIRIGARPAHCRIAVLIPSALMIIAYPVAWIVRGDFSLPHDRLGEAIGATSYLAVSLLFSRVATDAGAPIARLRLALLLVVTATGMLCASLGALPDDLMKYTPCLGMVLAMALLVSLLPRRQADPLPG